MSDPGKHYRHTFTRRLTKQELHEGQAAFKMDPYRIGRVYGLSGVPEHMVKKLLRGASKGHSEEELIAELQCCLDRWKEILGEENNG